MNTFNSQILIGRIMLCLMALPAILSFSTVEAKRKPSWVKQRPTDANYYYGRAMRSKVGGEASYRTEARNKALKELSSEIKVTISSNSILRQFENNYQVKEEFEASTHESVEATLEGYEVLTWENKKEYWVMVRLNKDKYAMRKKQKLDYAKKMCATYYYDGKKAVEKGNIYEGLLFYVQAIKAIKPHANEDLTYRDINGNLNLGSDIFSAIQEAFRKINLEAAQSSFVVQFSKEIKVPLSLQASYTDELGDSRPITNLPLVFSFTKGKGELTKTGTTDRDGKARCDIIRLISKRKSQEITAEFNLDLFLEEETLEDKVLLKAFFHDGYLPKTIFNIEVQKSTAFVVINELVFDKKTANGALGKSIRSELAQSYFNITEDKTNADFTVSIDAKFIEGGERQGKGYSVFIVFADFHMTVTDNKSQMEIFADGFDRLRGMQPRSYEYALKNVREKAKQKIIDEIFPKMEQVNL
ncbi:MULTISPECIES: LPP20 family lipoprotein [unclassified Saccharicrinis]|uniref:LPP20 family lipoprotein n=1 Tax=unclassified Saccharicrinis TaxID=2646859 RepID=UPI003D346483